MFQGLFYSLTGSLFSVLANCYAKVDNCVTLYHKGILVNSKQISNNIGALHVAISYSSFYFVCLSLGFKIILSLDLLKVTLMLLLLFRFIGLVPYSVRAIKRSQVRGYLHLKLI